MEQNKFPVSIEAIQERTKHICDDYGLSGNAIFYSPSHLAGSKQNRIYLVAGTDAAITEVEAKELRPNEIVQRIKRNEKLFYPKSFAVDVTDITEMKAYEELTDYCKLTEFLSGIYAEHGLPLPDKIRISEVHTLQALHDATMDVDMPVEAQNRCQRDLDRFFRREKSRGFRRRWLDYFRSDKFPDNKGPIAKLRGYFRRHRPEVSRKQLDEINADIQKLEMQEHEYKLFSEFMEKCYPEVSYAVGDLEIVNHGIDRPGRQLRKNYRRVTSEEFAVVRKERFAEEGWECLADMKPSYWEFRPVYFKEIDIPQVAAAYQAITLQYAQPDNLADVQGAGEIDLIRISATDFMNFVSLAKANGLRFYIDKVGNFATPDLDFINVIYNKKQAPLMADITTRMITDKVKGSHLLNFDQHPPLEERIAGARRFPRPSLSRRYLKETEKEL